MQHHFPALIVQALLVIQLENIQLFVGLCQSLVNNKKTLDEIHYITQENKKIRRT